MVSRKHILGLILLATLAMASAPACMAGNYVLLVEQTPMEGGIIDPGVGVHNFLPGETVTLTATPRPGYQFVRWMGDVSSTDTSSTTVTLNAPKMLVAVFEKVEYALLSPVQQQDVEQEVAVGGGGGGGRLTAQYPAIGGGGSVSPANTPLYTKASYSTVTPPDNKNEDTGGDIPVPTPEPGTIAMMILGASIVRWRRN